MPTIRVIAPVALLLAACLPTPAQPALPVLFEEGFEKDGLPGWQLETSNTLAEFKPAQPGQSSPRCLEVDKPDSAGMIVLRRPIPAPADHWVIISLGLETRRLAPFAEYYLWLAQTDAAGKPVGAGQGLAFDDGLARSSDFGGVYKTPQTLGEWKTTRHTVQVRPGATTLDLRVVFRFGAQTVRFDNLRIEDAGATEPRRETPPVFATELVGGVALLDLDMLTPSLTYELTATTESADHRGMGVRMSTVDLHGKATRPFELPKPEERGNDLVYRFTIPYDAVTTRLDLYSDDLRRQPYHNNAYRQWQRAVIRLVNTRPAEDTMMYNFEQGLVEKIPVPQPRDLVTVTEFDRAEIDAHLAQRPTVDAELKCLNGGMALVIGGKATPPIFACAFNWQNRYNAYGELGKRGLNVIRLDSPAGGPALSGQWLGPRQYDFSGLDAQVYNLLQQNRDALIILHFGGLYPPLWWGDQHPEEIIRNAAGQACSIWDHYGAECMWGSMDGGALGQAHERKWAGNTWLARKGAKFQVTYAPSPASQPYREVMKEYIVALRKHVESQPYGKAVIGYIPHWGYDYQWGWLGNVHNYDMAGKDLGPQLTDYSRPMHAYFREFLRRRYQSVENLRRAWHDPAATFETAAIPTPAQRRPAPVTDPNSHTPLPYLLDPTTQRNVLDYNECYALVLGDLVTDMSQAIKAAGTRKVVVGTYYQHVDRDMGHTYMLSHEGLDFSGGPDYDAREIGLAGISPHTHDSYRLHGKLEMTEIDHRIFPVLWRYYANNQLFETARKTVSVLQREFGRQMCRGEGAWLLDMGYGWYNEPIPADAMGQIREVFAKVLDCDRGSPARMAVFLSAYNYYAEFYSDDCNRRYQLSKYLRATLPHSGVPVDVYDIADLPTVAGRYRVFLCPLAFALTDEQAAQIEKLKTNGNLLVFGPAAGYVGTSGRSAERVAALTGMALKQDDSLPWVVRITNQTNAITKDLRGFIGCDDDDHQRVSFPMFQVTDPAAVTLAEYAGSGAGKAGLAYKDCGTWQSVYCGAMAPLPAELIRGLARQAKLHVYSEDGDVTFFANNLVAVHASTDGVKTLDLPEECHVTSLWDDRDVGAVKTIRRPMRTGDNALYLVLPVRK